MKTNILMVYPKTDLDKKGNSVGIPMSILYAISGFDKNKFQLDIIDQRVDTEWEKHLQHLLRKKDYLCVGISAMTGSQIKWALGAAKIIRKLNPNIKLVFGGVHPTICPEQTIMHPLVDIIILGDAEETFIKLADLLKNKKSLDKLKGIVYKKNGKIVNTGQSEMIELDAFPEPDYSLVNVNNYFLNLYNTKKALSLVTGRGCPHRCAFCYNPIFNKRRWRYLSVDNIIKRMKHLKYLGAQSIDIVDDNFFTDMNRVKEFCRRAKEEKLGLKFVVNCRADYVARFDDEFLKLLYDTGFREFYVGIESGSQKTLNHIKKDITLEQIFLCNKKLKKCGIAPIYSFMAGFPGESFEDIKETICVMMKLLRENPSISLTSLKIYTPFPGSELFEECVKQGLKIPKSFEDWSNFSYNSSSYEWRSKKMNDLLKKLSYITYFLDQKTMAEHLAKNKPMLRFFIRTYGKIVWFRCKIGFYRFLPEVYLMEKLKKFVE